MHGCAATSAVSNSASLAHQAPLSMGSPGKNTGVGCHALLQRNLPDPGMEPVSLLSLALASGFLITSVTWEDPSTVSGTAKLPPKKQFLSAHPLLAHRDYSDPLSSPLHQTLCLHLLHCFSSSRFPPPFILSKPTPIPNLILILSSSRGL